jgi:hypothetical protein
MKKLAAALSFGLVAGIASASTIEIQTGSYTGAAPLGSASAYQSAVDAAVSAPGATNTFVSSYDNLPIAIDNGALKSTITFDVASTATFEFQAGVDFGYGGAIYLDGNAEGFKSNDMWWAGSYSNPTQYFGFTAENLSAGVHTLTIYGMENCCSGNQQTQFKINDGSFTSFSNTDGLTAAAVPEAQSVAMLLAGLGLIGTAARRRSNKQA